MKPPKFAYSAPHALEQVFDLLERHDGEARLLAGGQSLVPALNFRMLQPSLLIDLGRIAELRYLQRRADGAIAAGAMTTHRDVEFSTLVAADLPLLHAAMPTIAHMAIRSRGTIGGSLAHADPAADWPALCLACDAVFTLRSRQGSRVVAAEDFALGLFETAIRPGELLTEISFPSWPSTRRFGFRKMTRRHGDFALVGVVCVVDRDADGSCTDCRIVVYGASDRPRRAVAAEALVSGVVHGDGYLRDIAQAARDAFEPPSDLHASATYRRELIAAMTRRALAQALVEEGATP